LSNSSNSLEKNPQIQAVTIQDLFEELGITSRQFHTFFGDMEQAAVVLGKMIYDKKGAPIDFVLLDVNPTFEKMFGIKREQVVLKKASEFFPKPTVSPSNWKEMCGRVANTGKPEQCEIYNQKMDKWFQLYTYSPLKTYFIAVLIDVTPRKIVENQYMQSEQWFRRLYETTLDGIMARDLEGKMIDCNRAYAKMIGYSKKELKRLPPQELLPKKWRKPREKIVKNVLRTGNSIVFEREYIRKDDSIFPASVRTWRLTNGKGKTIGTWSIVRDISQQKSLQKKLQEYAEALEKIVEKRTKQLKDSERLAAIGQTAGMVGHDLRNPLQTVIGELYLAKSEAESLPDNEVKTSLQESLRSIEEQASYMDKIVSDLQAFVQPIKMDKKPMDISQLISAVLEPVDIPQKISIEVQIEKDFPNIKADSQLLKRVLINLVTNAVQAMPDGGQLTIQGEVKSKDHVILTVDDTGVGIPEAIKPQIFTPLFTTKPRGQGFGLAVCKRVIEAHGGTIGFESTVGKGAKFTIQLPVN
jgi:PAS domain S-box-containing protein